ncbi:pantetheine-phosphate adenylyltransferase [Thermobifida fusca]|uniref:Phosphopantetheine adenylyltransferase n=2 Tax=Thermobifida fusca TaxID=2021 RepID=COAD_THEFY|nr:MULTISPECIES: pantetheine-phosphate adenylyltransferase [Thermobifida]Q47S81.1 RecName: Full=Phosphopantetheine adenylyltransferase; AltName: Full=Dephospho-CoA pyrophosphorylase; AltName: Full=Pantetheine-phosphate adenylyltransferase; Short=PPAT [Thermobifida fusca YX]AAZ54686.1 Phosphopantetheine adenylyltransferase [Thermobifida fusca YX]EOR72198.1 phosphopantetheine adenylyltransferase [Thermobifida fusca TM51]MBO2529455.1 phosphopantetheine adenylyltransferase [Thermobifida sp.]MDD679
MRRVVCPGSFDPVTNGHIDIIRRAAKQNEEVIVAVLVNVNKRGLFTADEKLEMLREATKEFDNVTVAKFDGLLVDFCRAHDVSAIVRSLRSVSDFDYELQIAQMNYQLSGIDTLFLTANPKYSFLSSSLVREIAQYNGDVSALVPPYVEERLRAKYAELAKKNG